MKFFWLLLITLLSFNTFGAPNRYKTVKLGFEAFISDVHHEFNINLGERPLRILGQLKNESKNCSLSIELDEVQAKKLEKLSNNLKICTHRIDSDIIIDADANYIVLKDKAGKEFFANKDLLGMDKEEFLCQGKKSFYSYVKTLVKKDLQREACPKDVLKSIF